ncbi:MAG: YkgJ family cysteine cluster protein [Blastochloris sp.]|nr:YkgJ family cysteine cluster protein [Blastochloris sp.]
MKTRQVFYQCQRCGHCCRWPGFVRLTSQDVLRLSSHLALSEEAFVQNHTHLNPDRSGLVLNTKENGECCFLEGVNHCQVQAVKPFQCGGFPNTWNFPGWREVCEAVEVETWEEGVV